MNDAWGWLDQIYCGTTPISKERQGFEDGQATRLGYEIRWIVGELVSEKRNLACTFNHLAAYRDALEHSYSKILVMEDDCRFFIDPTSFLKTASEQLESADPAWELFYLGAYPYGPLQPVSQYVRRLSKAVWLHCYAISSRLMPMLLEPRFMALYAEKPLDLVLHEEVIPRGHSYLCVPMVADQRPCWSEVAGKFEDMTGMFQDGLRWIH